MPAPYPNQDTSANRAEFGLLTELNVETRTVLAFDVRAAALKAMLPTGWHLAPAETGPNKGATVLVVFADRLLVEAVGHPTVPDKHTNQLAIVAAPAQNPELGTRGLMILFGLSAQSSGAPGPYGVFTPATGKVERLLASGPEGLGEVRERWDFRTESGEQLGLRCRYVRGVPARSETETRAYSAIDPAFYRTYHADQGALTVRSSLADVEDESDVEFQAAGARMGALFDSSQRLVSVTAIPWTVRRVYVTPDVSALQVQAAEPSKYDKPYRVLAGTLWVDTPSRTRATGFLRRGETVFLDKDLPEGARGGCRVRLGDGSIRYQPDVASLAKE